MMRSMVLAAFLGACGTQPPKPVEPPPPASPTGAVSASRPVNPTVNTNPFPWPTSASGAVDPACVRAEKRLRNGLAVESDVWLTVLCQLPRIPRDGVDEFLANVAAFLERIPEDYRKFPVAHLPKDLRSEFDADEIESWGPTIILVADEAAIERYPELAKFKHLGSGRLRGLCGNPFDRTEGHYEVTAKAVSEDLPPFNLKFSEAARNVIADAAQDPDLFDWENMAAHGQSSSQNGRPIGSVADTQKAWVAFIDEYVQRAVEGCGPKGGPDGSRSALYFLGYALHAVQDVASHRGRTNPEHAYCGKSGHDPDKDANAIKLARNMTTKFLHAVLQGRLGACAPLFESYSGPQVSFRDKFTLLNKELQLTPKSYWNYRRSAAEFEPYRDESTAIVRWFGPRGLFDAPLPACKADCETLLSRVAQ